MAEPVYCVWDAESTGIDVHEARIVQWFMATADKDGNLLDTWQWFIDPEIPIPQEATDVHGLTNEWLKENGQGAKTALNEIRNVFLDHLGLTHVAFNMAYDLSLIDAEFKRHGVATQFGTYMRDRAKLVDGIVIDRHHDKYRKGKRTLAAQATHYDVDYDPENLHDARVDVEVTAKVTARIVEKFGLPSTKEQAAWYAEWAAGLEDYLRREDATAKVDRNWPLRLKEEA